MLIDGQESGVGPEEVIICNGADRITKDDMGSYYLVETCVHVNEDDVATNECIWECTTAFEDKPEDEEEGCNTPCSPGFELDEDCNCKEVPPQPCSANCGEGYYQTQDCGCAPYTPPACRVTCSPGYTLINCNCVPIQQPRDCANVVGGSAYIASCGCIGGTTGRTSCDPCETAEGTTVISQNSNFLSAKASIILAGSDLLEHSITLGKDVNNQITQAPMNNSTGPYSVPVNTSFPGAFAALHNHPGNTPCSTGDIYAAVRLNKNNNNFKTSFVLTDGEVYAIVVTDLKAAKAFVEEYPAEQLPNQSPEFPDLIFNEIEDLKLSMGYSIEDRTRAIAFVLDKYKAGITLMKQDINGDFISFNTNETIQSDGSKTYYQIPYNN